MRWKDEGDIARVYSFLRRTHDARRAGRCPLPLTASDVRCTATAVARHHTRTKIHASTGVKRTIVQRRSVAAPVRRATALAGAHHRRRGRVHVVHFILRSFAAETDRRRRRAPLRGERANGEQSV